MKLNRALAVSLLALAVSACSWFRPPPEYKVIEERQALEVPSDLDRPDNSRAVTIPTVSATTRAADQRPREAVMTDYDAIGQGTRLAWRGGERVLLHEADRDATWSAVGVALGDSGLQLRDTDPEARAYQIAFVDHEAARERPGFFSRMVLRRKGPEDRSGDYRLIVERIANALTVVRVRTLDDAPVSERVAEAILAPLAEAMPQS